MKRTTAPGDKKTIAKKAIKAKAGSKKDKLAELEQRIWSLEQRLLSMEQRSSAQEPGIPVVNHEKAFVLRQLVAINKELRERVKHERRHEG
jgi:hypothetical protein